LPDFFTVLLVVLVSCLGAFLANAPKTNIERASAAVIAVFMAVSFPFSEGRSLFAFDMKDEGNS